MSLLPLCLGLWLDLRGTPPSHGLTALLDLYKDVRTRFDNAGLSPPAGSAVGGVLHLARDLVGEEDDPEDGGLSLLVLDGDGLYSGGQRVGATISLSSSSESELKRGRARALEVIRRPEDLALLGDLAPSADRDCEAGLRALFEFSHSAAQQCRSISGCETRILCAASSQEMLGALEAVAADDEGVEVVAILRRDPALWFDALNA